MSKTFGFLLMGFTTALLIAFGFLGYLYSDLNTRYFALEAKYNQGEGSNSGLNQSVTSLEKDLTNQSKSLTTLNTDITNMKESLKKFSENEYLPAPDYALDETVFTVGEKNNKKIKVIGNKESITKWIDNNEIYLDYAMKKTLPLKFDQKSRKVMINGIIENSIFHQMGLKDGDLFVNINGKVLGKGYDLRRMLIDLKAKKIALIRDKKYMVLNVSYEDKL
jgi:hypothetical protein